MGGVGGVKRGGQLVEKGGVQRLVAKVAELFFVQHEMAPFCIPPDYEADTK